MATPLDALTFALDTLRLERPISTHTHRCELCDRSWTHLAACEVYDGDRPLDTRTWTDPKVCRDCARGV